MHDSLLIIMMNFLSLRKIVKMSHQMRFILVQYYFNNNDVFFCLFNLMIDIKLFEYNPSVIAASALLYVAEKLIPMQFLSFKNAIFRCEYVKSVRFNYTCMICVTLKICYFFKLFFF